MKSSRRWLGRMFMPLFVGFFGFVFFWLQAPQPANAHTKAQVKAREATDALLAQPVVDFSFVRNQPEQMPFESLPAPAEVEVTDEREVDDDNNEEFSETWATIPVEETYHLGIRQDLFHDLMRSFQNRSTVYLFVLHHSWKSFLI